MKLVAIILSIFTLVLSATPCDDEGVLASEQLTSLTQDFGQANPSDMDLCTPFCSCVCCSGVVLEPIIEQDFLILEIPSKVVNTIYAVSFGSNYLSKIYQPPQV